MAELWQSMDLFEQVVFLMAIPATIVIFLQLILLFFSLGGDDFDAPEPDVFEGDGYNDFSIGDMGGLRLLTVRGVMAFLAVGGWATLWLSGKLGRWPALAAGIFAGLLAMFLLALALRAAKKLQQEGNLELERAIGREAVVYIPIFPGREGGKVSLVLQGRLCELNAITEGEALSVGDTVVVKSVEGTSLKVTKKI